MSIENLINSLDNVKEKLSSQEYKDLIEEVAAIKIKQDLYEYHVIYPIVNVYPDNEDVAIDVTMGERKILSKNPPNGNVINDKLALLCAHCLPDDVYKALDHGYTKQGDTSTFILEDSYHNKFYMSVRKIQGDPPLTGTKSTHSPHLVQCDSH